MRSRHRLSRAAGGLRALHAAIAAVELVSLGYVWGCALTGRRAPRLELASGLLVGEGVGLVVGGGDCPLGPLQERVGDPVPLFEFVLPPRAARLAVPALASVALGGIALAAKRPGYRLRRQPSPRAIGTTRTGTAQSRTSRREVLPSRTLATGP